MNRLSRASRRTPSSASQTRISRVTLALLRIPRTRATSVLVAALAGISHAGSIAVSAEPGSGDCCLHFRSIDARQFRG